MLRHHESNVRRDIHTTENQSDTRVSEMFSPERQNGSAGRALFRLTPRVRCVRFPIHDNYP